MEKCFSIMKQKSSQNHKLNLTKSEICERKFAKVICTDFDCVVIVSDFNIRVKPQDRNTKVLCCVLANYGLTEQVISKGLIISKHMLHFLIVTVFSLRAQSL